MFTARYGLGPYTAQIRFVFKGLMLNGKLTVPDVGTGVLFSCRLLILIVKMVEVVGLLSQWQEKSIE